MYMKVATHVKMLEEGYEQTMKSAQNVSEKYGGTH
jgi:hypothetical protein